MNGTEGEGAYVLVAGTVVGTGGKDTEPGLEQARVGNAELAGHEAAGRESGDGDGRGVNVIGRKWDGHGSSDEGGGAKRGRSHDGWCLSV